MFDRIDDVCWSGKDIKVMEQVTIKPPYLPENVIGNADKAVNHVKKIVSFIDLVTSFPSIYISMLSLI